MSACKDYSTSFLKWQIIYIVRFSDCFKILGLFPNANITKEFDFKKIIML